MTFPVLRPFATALVLVLALVAPVSAQDVSAKDAWSDLRDLARAQGIQITTQGVTDYGTSLVAQGVRITIEREPGVGAVEMPELRVEPRGAAVALIPSPVFTLTVQPGSRDAAQVVTISHSGEIVLEVANDRLALDLLFDRLGAVLTRLARQSPSSEAALELSFDGLTGRFLAQSDGLLELDLGADTTRYAFSFANAESRSGDMQQGDAEIVGLHLEVAGTRIDTLSDRHDALRTAFDAGFSLRIALAAQSSVGASRQVTEGIPIAVDSVSGEGELALNVADGALTLQAFGRDGILTGTAAPLLGEVRYDELGFSVGAPLLVTDEDQTAYFRFNFDNVVASPELLQAVGAQDFGGEALTLALGVSAQTRLLEDVGPRLFAADEPPLDMTSVDLEQLEMRLGGTEFTGSGAFAFLGGMRASLGADLPNGTGDFVFDLLGGDRLLTRLSDLGLVPQDQQFFARMMMNGLGRPVGDDHLRSEVAVRPGGVLTVNGAPLPF